MKLIQKLLYINFILTILSVHVLGQSTAISFCGNAKNDLYLLLQQEGFKVKVFDRPQQAILHTPPGGALIIVADKYPLIDDSMEISESLLEQIKKKNIKAYIEYPSGFPGMSISQQPLETRLERAVVTSTVFGKSLPPMSILGINHCFVLQTDAQNPVMVLAKVVGFDKAVYGLDNTVSYPLLFQKGNVTLAMTKLSNFATARHAPASSIKTVWSGILATLTSNPSLTLTTWVEDVSPTYTQDERLPHDARIKSVKRGIHWFYNSRLFVDSSWKQLWEINQGNPGASGSPLTYNEKSGDGKLGIIEGHASTIHYDGKQNNNYWMRADVQGEVSMALAAAARQFNNPQYQDQASNLLHFLFKTSNLRSGEKNDKKSPAYGLIGWATTNANTFYGDDNARAILGAIGATAYIKDKQWDKYIVEAIMANFRTTGQNGFRGERLEQEDIIKNGLAFYQNRDLVYLSPHFESWMWACYLWLYDKTGHAALLEKTKKAIKITMDGYPSKWLWGSSMQTQRARMILPLAWLVRIENTEQHRLWLDQMINEMLKFQLPNGAIREEIGVGKGHFRELKTNDDYGTDEASLIFQNGDPVAEMLYTCNFALFSLNEAMHATGNERYRKAASRLSDFLTRVQVSSKIHPDLDGAWFRAFDYNRWEYWASNADKGWGAWCTLSGWIQSWIVTTQLQIENRESYWEITGKEKAGDQLMTVLKSMAD